MKDYTEHRLTVSLEEPPEEPEAQADSKPDGKLYARDSPGTVRITWGQVETLPADALGHLIKSHFRGQIEWLRLRDGEISFEDFTAAIVNN